MLYRIALSIIFSVFVIPLFSQVIIKGYVSDHENRPISAVSIQELKTQTGTSTNRSGYFEIKVSDTDTAIIRLSHVSYQTCIDTVVIDNNISTLSIFLEEITSVLDNIEVLDKSNVQGINTALLNAQSFKDITVPFSDFSGVIKSLPGVVSNNELSSTYSVRGGSFNENMIYVNGIPVYRPFLISNGQQEGLSFINSDFVRSVSFSAGGWNASKADRLSSVLDVFYKNTDKLEINVDAGLLGGKLFLGGRNKSGKLQYMLGVRKKTSKYLFKGLEVKGEYFPNFIDLQGYVKLNLKNSSISFLTNFANNDYTVQPTSRQSDFGTLNNTYRIFIAFEGSENMEYKTLQNAVKWEWDLTKKWNLNLIASLVSSREYEFYDIESAYRLCDIDKNPSSPGFNTCITERGAGINYNYGRNRLEANLGDFQLNSTYEYGENSSFDWGFSLESRNIADQLKEYDLVDSTGYIKSLNSINSKTDTHQNISSAYINHTFGIGNESSLSYGIRFSHSDFTHELLSSPRAQLTYKPILHRKLLMKTSIGIYRQFPLYREYRKNTGDLNYNIKAQSSFHLAHGFNYDLLMYGRPFKFTGELYYKKLWNVIPFDVDNVRLRYYGDNNAVAYAYGADFRLNGEFIKDAESWFSLSYLNTKEDIFNDDKGYIRRPFDQRITFGIHFQDYFPQNPNMKVNLNLLFGSGMPFGVPNSLNQRSIYSGKFYRRVDIGFIREFNLKNGSMSIIKLEILNLLGASNVITYSWVKDINGNSYAIPNTLSARFINLKIAYNL